MTLGIICKIRREVARTPNTTNKPTPQFVYRGIFRVEAQKSLTPSTFGMYRWGTKGCTVYVQVWTDECIEDYSSVLPESCWLLEDKESVEQATGLNRVFANNLHSFSLEKYAFNPGTFFPPGLQILRAQIQIILCGLVSNQTMHNWQLAG